MSLSREDLDAAVEAGIIDAQTKGRLLSFVEARAEGMAGPDNESFRLLTGFNDIFVTLACILLLVAVGSLAPDMISGLYIAAAAWGLAEYFTRKRHMALPSVLLLLVFVSSIFNAVWKMVGQGSHFAQGAEMLGNGGANAVPGLMAAGAAAVGASVAHWFRFRVPITLAAGALGLVVLLCALALQITGEPGVLVFSMLFCGLAVFALAMRFDISDRARITRNTDIAFWLHLLAAPLIVHPVFSLTGLIQGYTSPGAALAVLLVYLALTLVALAIDRRALLVSALAYVLVALNGLFLAGNVAAGFGLTALVLGSFLVMLSAAWGALRKRLLQHLPEAWLSIFPVAPKGRV